MKKEKVSLVECRTYDYELVKKSIIKSFENLGGIDKYINKGETVLLKLNLLMKKKPEEATTTHPVFTKALAEVIIEYGANVLIGDSPGGPFNSRALKGIYRACGIEAIANEVNAKLNYNTNTMEVKNVQGKILKGLAVTEMLKDVDKVISVSKLKTHGMAMFTGAVKNMFGIIPGVLKAEYHLKMPNIEDFSDALVDICLYANPILSFMDGIVGMEGDGPSAGDPREVGVIISSTSPYHLDVVATSIINLEPTKVPTIQRCVERGICKGNFDDIELVGEKIEKFRIDDFKIPEIKSVNMVSDKAPKFLRNFINAWLRPKPVFIHEDCVSCGVCEENCPPQVITMENSKPIANLDECIRCFCCQELCPKKAVKIHRPWLLDKLSKL
ncbi:iron-sulfur protein [Caloranaerobacter sp. TR13]|uniref:DUF362 domain-containing protein n=1 Tax=Caloranaerobacter sp. TR13 TaxID=1302151 RepID=UPI0006D3C780|nr:DUF362 domain-containing protein [Caloranaerobacter sp. TR13]KPU28349.1 iron-sulfur protein [Caloranaerobacter sp. TR13]